MSTIRPEIPMIPMDILIRASPISDNRLHGFALFSASMHSIASDVKYIMGIPSACFVMVFTVLSPNAGALRPGCIVAFPCLLFCCQFAYYLPNTCQTFGLSENPIVDRKAKRCADNHRKHKLNEPAQLKTSCATIPIERG